MRGQLIPQIACLLLLLLLQACGPDTESPDRVKHGEFVASLIETGELQAVNARVITMPNYDLSFG